LDHVDHGVMDDTLALGVRTTPSLKPWRFGGADWRDGADGSAVGAAKIDWALPMARTEGAAAAAGRPSTDGRDWFATAVASRNWKLGFVNELGAPEWSKSPNARLVIELPKADRGRAL
ncbi:MAG TPA: hypothetical protein VFQ16_16570, partial [Burkholderiaceae bacterium]|nr:hypothetical protein [Burkholderiaceae bacterium]